MLIIKRKRRKSLSNGFTLYFPHVNATFQSIFHMFLSRFTQNLFTRKSTSFSFHHLFFAGRIDCVIDNSKVA